MKTLLLLSTLFAAATLLQPASADGVISGKVFGQDGTTTIQDAYVAIYFVDTADENNPKYYAYSNTKTDAYGSYSFSVPYGTWVVEFSVYDSVAGELLLDYHYRADDKQSATLIRLLSGVRVGDINGYLYTRFGSISGRVTGPDGTTPLGGIRVAAEQFSDSGAGWNTVGTAAYTDSDGMYRISKLPVGNYRIKFYDDLLIYQVEYYNNGPDNGSGEDVAVTRAVETPDINASLDYREGQGPDILIEHPLDTVLEDGQGSVSFGNGTVGKPVARTLTIRNTGTAALTGIAAEVRGTHASDFTADAPGSQTLAPGEETTLSVRFTPSATGPRSATLGVLSNDADENPFEISLSGGGLSPKQPEIVVQQGTGMNKNLTDNKSKRGFGSVKTGRKSKPMAFLIKNTGKSTLNNIAISLGGRNAKDFRIVEAPRKSVDPGKSTGFAIQYKPRKQRTSSALLVIANNDSDENPFRIRLSGRGIP
jgi:hypothetical protein